MRRKAILIIFFLTGCTISDRVTLHPVSGKVAIDNTETEQIDDTYYESTKDFSGKKDFPTNQEDRLPKIYQKSGTKD